MDSDSDFESDLPPGWELSTLNGEICYLNNINKTKYLEHPLGQMKKSNKSCLKENFIQKFDSFSTSEKVLKNKDCSQDVAVVIGGCSGIGLETVHYLSSRHCRVILGCKDVTTCTKDVTKRIDENIFHSLITILPLNLESLKSVKEFIKLVIDHCETVTMIVLSAAVMYPPYIITEDGFESSFQINCFSQFYLAYTLLESFSFENTGCRVLFLTCESHRIVKTFKLSDLSPSKSDYDGYYAYALSNLLKIILTQEMSKRIKGINVSFFACHPGNVINNTKINRYSPKLRILFWLFDSFTKTLSQAAATPLFCLTSSSIKQFSGCYFNNGCICDPSSLTYDKSLGKLIWDYMYGLYVS